MINKYISRIKLKKRPIPLNADSQPLFERINIKRVTERQIDELIGLCKGVAADNIVSQQEAEFLLNWINANKHAANQWPVSVLYARINDMLKDGVLDKDEQRELLDLLRSLVENDAKNISMETQTSNLSTSLPLTSPAPNIRFKNKRFCLTGKFITGPRAACEAVIRDNGGIPQPRPTRETDYLVIGVIGSRDWIHSTHGRKIEHVVKLNESGSNIKIVSEQHWKNFI